MSNDDPLLTAAEVAAHLGITVGTWRGYVSRARTNPGANPAPQPRRADFILDGGHHRPRWRQSVVDAWNRRRNPKAAERCDECLLPRDECECTYECGDKVRDCICEEYQ